MLKTIIDNIVNNVLLAFSNLTFNFSATNFDKTIITTLDAISNNTKYKAVNINAKFIVTPHINKIREAIGIIINAKNPYSKDFGKFLTKSGYVFINLQFSHFPITNNTIARTASESTDVKNAFILVKVLTSVSSLIEAKFVDPFTVFSGIVICSFDE